MYKFKSDKAMFYPFKPRRQPDASDPSVQRLTQKIRIMQRSWKQRLKGHVARAPSKKLKIVLITALILLCLIASLLVYRGVSGKIQSKAFWSIPSLFGSISVPKGPTKLQRLEWYLDSLERAIAKDSIDYLNKIKHDDYFKLH